MFNWVRALAGIIVATAAIVLTPSAFAQDVVVNGGFEGGSNAPWVGPGWSNSSGGRNFTASARNTCSHPSCLNVGSFGGQLYQDVVTTPGTTYTLTFWYLMIEDGLFPGPIELQALLSNGVPTSGGAGTCTGNCVFRTEFATGGYTQAIRTFVATSASTRITFLGRSDFEPQNNYVDDVSFVVAPPTVTALSPSTSDINGGIVVTITGTNFTGATSVTFGGVSATFTVVNVTTITATAPIQTGGVKEVVVTTPIGANDTAPTTNNFTVLFPVPTMGEWAMILFGLILAGGAALYIQRRQMAI